MANRQKNPDSFQQTCRDFSVLLNHSKICRAVFIAGCHSQNLNIFAQNPTGVFD